MLVSLFRQHVKKHHDKLKFYDSITGMSKILRRYFVMNSFDGALTIFGLLLGVYSAGVDDSHLVIALGISTSLAVGVSGFTGAMLTETAERKREIKSMEKALQRNLDDTDYKRAYEFASVLAGLVDGFSPILASLVLLSPFFFMPALEAYPYAFGLGLAAFFALGMFLGKISKENIFATGVKLLLAGIFCMAMILLLDAV
jgi:predicted membrane protein (TIGR00267 family)